MIPLSLNPYCDAYVLQLVCPQVGGKELSALLFHRNFGYDSMPYDTTMTLHPWKPAPYRHVYGNECDVVGSHGHRW